MTPRCVSSSCVAGPHIGIPETQFWRLSDQGTVRSCAYSNTGNWIWGQQTDCLTASTGQKPSREANSSSASRRNYVYLWNAKFHYHVQNSPPIVLSLARLIQSTVSLPIYSISISVLSPIYALDFTMVPLLHVSQPNHCMHLSSPHTCCMSHPSHPLFAHPNNNW